MLDGSIQSWDERRDIAIEDDAIAFCADHWIHTAQRAIQQRGKFFVALSGGTTPKAIYQELSTKHKKSVDWSLVYLFWSDERAVPPDHARSNYQMALESGLLDLPIPKSQIFRMQAETEIEKSAARYEETIRRICGPHLFDLVMLGVGEDGHTASLFPNTAALRETSRLVSANQIVDTGEWRMTFTFPCINGSARAVIYALGSNKQAIVSLVLNAAIESHFPASAVGTSAHKALWILDRASAHLVRAQN